MSRYVLDTSALITYIENEEGVSDVERIITEALDEKHELFISVVSCIELFYISLREQGRNIALERLQLINDLPLTQESLTQAMIQTVGEIKECKAMSFADCCVAGLAKIKKAILIHKDPEFEQLKDEVEQLKLPYKQ